MKRDEEPTKRYEMAMKHFEKPMSLLANGEEEGGGGCKRSRVLSRPHQTPDLRQQGEANFFSRFMAYIAHFMPSGIDSCIGGNALFCFRS